MHFVPRVMPNHRSQTSSPTDSRDTLEVSVDELERPSNPVDFVSAAGPKVRGGSIAAFVLAVASVVLASALVFRTVGHERHGPPAKGAAAILPAGAKNAATPSTGSDAPELTCSEANALVPEQYIELDAVKLKGRPEHSAR